MKPKIKSVIELNRLSISLGRQTHKSLYKRLILGYCESFNIPVSYKPYPCGNARGLTSNGMIVDYIIDYVIMDQMILRHIGNVLDNELIKVLNLKPWEIQSVDLEVLKCL